MARPDASQSSAGEPLHYAPGTDPHRWSAVRIAGIYLIAGLLWIGLSDAALALAGGLTVEGFGVAAAKGSIFVLLSTGLVFWLCRREYRTTTESMTLLRAVVEGTTDAVFVKDRDGKYLLVNSAGAQFIGKSVEEVLGRDDSELFESADSMQLMANDRLIMTGKRVVTLEETLTSAGLTRTYQAMKAPYIDATGAVAGLIGISRNITDRVQVEAVLRETDARLREAQRIARLGSWSWEPPTDRVWWSDAEFELFGVDPAMVRPSFDAFLTLLHPDDRDVAIKRVDDMLAGANEFANDLRIVRSDGSCMWIHSQARATRDARGRLLRVDGIDQDITAARIASEAVAESQRRLQAAIEVAKLGILVVDYQQQTVSLSPRACEQFGFSPDVTISRAELHSRFHPDDVELIQKLIDESLDPNGSGCFALEHRVIRSDGSIRWLNVRKQVSFMNGQPHGAVLVTADVTERRQAEARLREQDMLVLEAAELAKVGGWGFDPITLTADWTPEVAHMFGLGSNTPPAMHEVLKFCAAEHLPTLQSALEAARQHGTPHDLELQIVAADGVRKWVRTICRPIVEGNRVVRVRGSLQDITDRKYAEEVLHASEKRLRLALEAAGAIAFVWEVPEDMVTRYFSTEPALPATSERLGTLSEVRARVHPDDLPNFDARLNSCLTNGSEYRNAYRVVRPDGTSTHLEEYGFLDRASDGSPLRLTGMSIDVSNRVAAIDSLRTSEERLRVALKGARGGVWDWDLSTGTAWWSPEMYELMGAHVGDDTSSESAIQFVYSDDRALVLDAVAQAIAQRTDYHCEFRVQGGARWLSSHAHISMDESDKPVRLVGISWDITARRQLEEQFRQAQKMEAVGRLAGGVAHDFNNLLTVINGYSELILSDLSIDHPIQGPLTAIHDAGDRAARLTKQLLALSRKSMVEPRLVDLNELIAESANLFRRLIGEDITLLVLADSKPVRVIFDPGQLEQVLMNLVINARDAMPDGGRLTIETRLVVLAAGDEATNANLPPGRYALLRVADTGCGITADFQDKIFEPFFTTKGIGKGTGLGLAVVHGVVQQSGGSVTVESVEGRGATFKIWLPAADEAVNDAVAIEPHASLQGRESVLVVEDEEAVRTLVRFTLEEQGYQVHTASTGIDALEMIRHHPSSIDLLVTDMIMPGISGRELAEEARKQRPALRVVYMSGYTDDALGRYGLQGTSDQFIQKPFTPLGLVRKIRSVLDQT